MPKLFWITVAFFPFLIGAKGERIELPFDIWIILVVTTGGIYLIVFLFRTIRNTVAERRYSEQRKKLQQHVNQISQVFAEVITAILENETEEIENIFSKHNVAADQQEGIVETAVVVLQEIVHAQERKETSLDGVKSRLQTTGLSSEFADILIQAASRALGKAA